MSSLIVILIPWSSIYILVSGVCGSFEVVQYFVVGSLSSSEAESDGGVIGLAISLPLILKCLERVATSANWYSTFLAILSAVVPLNFACGNVQNVKEALWYETSSNCVVASQL
ncbi:hypothetical protein Tco_1303474 [Tanacetum coccineum]